MTTLLWAIVVAGLLSIVYGIVTTRTLLSADAGSARMQEISAAVREGASAYLRRQYTPRIDHRPKDEVDDPSSVLHFSNSVRDSKTLAVSRSS